MGLHLHTGRLPKRNRIRSTSSTFDIYSRHTYAEFSAADDFVNSLSADSSTYAQCQEHANLFKQAACAAALSWDVGEAIAVLGVSIGAELGSRIIGSIINLISSVGW